VQRPALIVPCGNGEPDRALIDAVPVLAELQARLGVRRRGE
jgi:hypothetical protein